MNKLINIIVYIYINIIVIQGSIVDAGNFQDVVRVLRFFKTEASKRGGGLRPTSELNKQEFTARKLENLVISSCSKKRTNKLFYFKCYTANSNSRTANYKNRRIKVSISGGHSSVNCNPYPIRQPLCCNKQLLI